MRGVAAGKQCCGFPADDGVEISAREGPGLSLELGEQRLGLRPELRIRSTRPVQVQGSLEDVVVPMAMNLDGLGFDRPGGYAFVLSVSGVEEERLEFSVGEVQPGQPPERTTSGVAR